MYTIYDYAFNSPILQKTVNILTELQFFKENKIDIPDPYKDETKLIDSELNHAAFLASILASSPTSEHRQKAIAFATLLYLHQPRTQFASYCYIILSRTGNVQQGKLLPILDEKSDRFLVRFDEMLNLELSTERASVLLNIDSKPIYLSKFQKELWNMLQEKHSITAITGPTSSGKSFMIQNHVLQLSKTTDHFKAVYVVPTRALISEVSSVLRKKLSAQNVMVKIAAGEANDDREILVLTPERCLQLLRTNRQKGTIKFIFFDEIQKIEDDERGVLLEYVFRELLQAEKNAQFVLAGPYLKNLNSTVLQLSDKDGQIVESQLSPVYQLKTILRINRYKGDMEVILKNRHKGENPSILIDKAIDTNYTHQPDVIAQIVTNYASESKNIIYAPRRVSAENIALSIAKLNKIEESKLPSELKNLVDYLTKEIHEDCSLVRCLKSGVAFHHGMIPEMAKVEIEELYKKEDGLIKNIVCTTTLLEGVNLPADRIFVYRPWKKDSKNPLSDFDFGNLTGRAGRANLKLNGSVYCIEFENDRWAEEKFDSDPTKEITPVTTKVISGTQNEELFKSLSENSKTMNTLEFNPAVIFTTIILRQKALSNPQEFQGYIQSKNIPQEEAQYISSKIIESVRNLDIPKDVIKINPTIDPILQNELYKQIRNDREHWIISKTPMSDFGRKSEDEFKNLNFYSQFEEITRKLDSIFGIEWIIRRKRMFRHWYRPPAYTTLTYYGINWIEQKPLSYIIRKELNGNKNILIELEKIKKQELGEEERLRTIDRAILEVIDHINNNVRFELVKYFKLWADILNELLDKNQKEKYARVFLIPEMLELGAYQPNVVAMIRAGISRSAAIEANKILQKTDPHFEGDVIAWLIENIDKFKDPIYRKHLERLGFIRPKKEQEKSLLDNSN